MMGLATSRALSLFILLNDEYWRQSHARIDEKRRVKSDFVELDKHVQECLHLPASRDTSVVRDLTEGNLVRTYASRRVHG